MTARRILLTLLFLSLLPALSTRAEPPEFESLFDGETLEGWQGDLTRWSVQDGAIVGETVADRPVPANTFLIWTGGEVTDFELLAKVRFRGNNSGVQYRSQRIEPGGLALSGYQMDLHSRPAYFGMLYAEKYENRRIIAQRGQTMRIGADGKKDIVEQREPGEKLEDWAWNEIRIVAVGSRLIHQVNGKTTIDVTDGDPRALEEGLVGLQLHRGKPMRVEFRDLLLRRLDAAQGRNLLARLEGKPEPRSEKSPPSAELGEPVGPRGIAVARGFRVETLHEVDAGSQGSWVALTLGPAGALVASDQGEKGLFRISDLDRESGVTVERHPVELSGAQGLAFLGDTLYAFKNGAGIYRVTDTNSDGRLDRAEKISNVTGRGEHGNHALLPGAPGGRLYALAGNSTPLPGEGSLKRRRVQSWAEDLLLPRQWDARGHARGRMAPGGWATIFDPATGTHELVGIGFRNAYDIALGEHGELFTFDADMEWDLGLPWYRPTRICHVVSGSDHGWRSGSGKWPSHHEDSLPPVVDIGPGSPTGLVSGRGARFPARYQRALFALDWTFGRILAVHLEPSGASYRGTFETFLTGRPLPVTDAVIGTDGALYFAVGGRGAPSSLLRVVYEGGESVEPAGARPLPAATRTRRELEAFHGRVDPAAIERAWPHLGSPDRFLRHAARVAVESQPVEAWAARVFVESRPRARIAGAVALARTGSEKHRAPLLECLTELEFERFRTPGKLGLLRAFSLVLERLGNPGQEQGKMLVEKLERAMSDGNPDVDHALLELLVHLGSPAAVPAGLDLIARHREARPPAWVELAVQNPRYGGALERLAETPPPTRSIGFAFTLRNVRKGWTPELRRRYFEFLNEAGKTGGGASFPGFLSNLRLEALASCTDEERRALEDLTGENFDPVPDFPILPVEGPGREWKLEEALAATAARELSRANFERGRSLYHATGCGSCHRFQGLGGGVGPDLTSVPLKFDARYVVEAIVDPGKDISDQYSASTVVLRGGEVLEGLVVEESSGAITVYPPQQDGKGQRFEKAQVLRIQPASISPMPSGLLDPLNASELRDLVAYLLSGGDPSHRFYKARRPARRQNARRKKDS